VTVLLVVLVIGFAYSMGAHYTGACMGMPHALSAISARAALLVMAPLALVGATFASHGVEHTVGHNLLTGQGLSVTGLVIVIGIAFALTSAFNRLRIPTSTIQILVFTVVGAGLAAGIGIRWRTIAALAAIWVIAPFVAAVAGYVLTKAFDRVPAVRLEARRVERLLAGNAPLPTSEAGQTAQPAAEPVNPPADRSAGGRHRGGLRRHRPHRVCRRGTRPGRRPVSARTGVRKTTVLMTKAAALTRSVD
jgi:phosphate/sulfate permease